MKSLIFAITLPIRIRQNPKIDNLSLRMISQTGSQIYFFYHKLGAKYFLLRYFFEKSGIFQDKDEWLFLRDTTLLKERVHLKAKVNPILLVFGVSVFFGEGNFAHFPIQQSNIFQEFWKKLWRISQKCKRSPKILEIFLENQYPSQINGSR